MRTCKQCKRSEPEVWLAKDRTICRPCEHLNWESKRQAEGKDPWLERRKASTRARVRNLKQFRKTIEVDYELLLASQGGLCKICRRSETKTRNGKLVALCLDHCHKTGTIRGLLCYRCNVALGFFDDDVSRLQEAIRYLELYQCKL